MSVKRAPTELDLEVQQIEGGGKRYHVEAHETVTYRWEPYKPDGQRQMKAKGRWQKRAARGDVFFEWVNCERDDAIFALKQMMDLSRKIKAESLMHIHPGYKKPYPIQTVLRDMASQEGCDGEPYNAMVFAANFIDVLIGQQLKASADHFDTMANLGNSITKQDEELVVLKATIAALAKIIENIAELNMTGEDENGNRWANSDLIEQEIVQARGITGGVK